MLRYRGYISKIDFDERADVFYGVVVNARALLSFEGGNAEQIKQSFHDVVDSYLEVCERKGISPEKPYSGRFNVQISPKLHKKLAIKSAAENLSQNKYVEKVLERELQLIED